MRADVLGMISYVAFACSFLFILLSVVLFVKLDIRSIIDDLSGRKAERQIQALREQNTTRQGSMNIILEESELTEQLCSETGLMSENETMLLEEIDRECKLILNEMVVHTEERI